MRLARKASVDMICNSSFRSAGTSFSKIMLEKPRILVNGLLSSWAIPADNCPMEANLSLTKSFSDIFLLSVTSL